MEIPRFIISLRFKALKNFKGLAELKRDGYESEEGGLEGLSMGDL
jgi:hypothetical protein